MRYLLDTCIVVDMIKGDDDFINDLIYDYSNLCYVSGETVKELVVLYRHKKMFRNRWKSEKDLIKALGDEYNIQILPLTEEVYMKYADLTINTEEEHNDPSDHIIIAHAMTMKMALISSDRKFRFYMEQGLELVCN